MRVTIATIIGIAIIFALAGCGEKPEITRAVQVENPPAEPVSHQAVESNKSTPPAEPVAKNASVPKGFIKTASGLMYKDRKVGKGTSAKAGDKVTVHYKGWLDNGQVFDSSRRPGRDPFSFTLGRGEVIKGWDEGIVGMKPGGVRELIIPPSLGYGDQDLGNIPPNSTLHFEVELLKVGG